jgi:hypothetical protein
VKEQLQVLFPRFHPIGLFLPANGLKKNEYCNRCVIFQDIWISGSCFYKYLFWLDKSHVWHSMPVVVTLGPGRIQRISTHVVQLLEVSIKSMKTRNTNWRLSFLHRRNAKSQWWTFCSGKPHDCDLSWTIKRYITQEKTLKLINMSETWSFHDFQELHYRLLVILCDLVGD